MRLSYSRKFPLLQTVLLIVFFASNVVTIGKAILLALVAYIFNGKNFKRYVDSNFILIIFFFLLYFTVSLYDNHKKTEVNIQLIFVAPILYLCGKWFGDKATNSVVIVRVFWLVGLALAFISLHAIFADIVLYGFSGGSRNLTVSVTGSETSATVLAGMLVVLVAYSGVVFSTTSMMTIAERILIFSFFLLAIFAATRIGSRTILIIGLVSLAQGFYTNRRNYSALGLFATLCLLLGLAYLIFNYATSIIDITSYYQDRLNSEEYGFGSAGGRFDKWVKSFTLMIEYPLGWGIDVNGYSHNLWLDVSRNGGFISFLLILLITFRVVKLFIKSAYRNSNDICYVTAVACIGTSYLILFFVEPIFDGFIYVFASFCTFWGMVQAFRPKDTQCV